MQLVGARQYDPAIGRFMGVDPQEADPNKIHSINRYAYANNNPQKYVDPDGHSPIDLAFLVYDVGALASVVYHGDGVGGAAFDVGLSLVGVISPIPGAGQAIKAARAATHAVDGLRAAERVGEVARGTVVGAESAVEGLKLNKSLASQAQMSEAGTTIAGAGASVSFRDAVRAAKEHGGNAADWSKKSSSSYTARDGTTLETHWLENAQTGQRVEFKTKFLGGDGR